MCWHCTNIDIGNLTSPENASFPPLLYTIAVILKLKFLNPILTPSLSYPHTAVVASNCLAIAQVVCPESAERYPRSSPEIASFPLLLYKNYCQTEAKVS